MKSENVIFEQFMKIEILPVFMIKTTAEISKILVKIFYDFGKAEIKITYFFQIKLSSATSQNGKN